MRFAYADPPYYGYARFYADLHPEALIWDDLATHRDLITRLCDEYPDGWALSLVTPNLRDILPLCPADARVGGWVKPFCSFKPGVNPAYAWEPVIWRGGRKRDRDTETVRDWVAASITLKRGLTGGEAPQVRPLDFRAARCRTRRLLGRSVSRNWRCLNGMGGVDQYRRASQRGLVRMTPDSPR